MHAFAYIIHKASFLFGLNITISLSYTFTCIVAKSAMKRINWTNVPAYIIPTSIIALCYVSLSVSIITD